MRWIASLSGALEKRLAEGRPLRAKLGLDPTAADVHLGHTVVLQKLREFQDLGHTVVLIIGDYTARVGDPSGRSATRPVLSGEEIDANARTYVDQAAHVLRTDERLEIRHNSEWLDMSMESLFGLVRHATVAQLLERDDFAKRFAAHQPISLLELLYPVLQGYDSVAVRADVELGGTDQTFNLLMGRAIQSAYGQPQQVVLTVPLLVGTDGVEKMSKSVGNHVGVTDPPDDMFGKVLSIPDAAMPSWYDLLLGSPPPEGESPRDQKRALARALVTRYHGPEAAAAPRRTSTACTSRARCRTTSRRSSSRSPRPSTSPSCWATSSACRAPTCGARSARAASASTASRSPSWTSPPTELAGRVLQIGKRRFFRLVARELMAVHTALLRLQTEGEGQIIDLSAGIESALRAAEVSDGVVTVFVTGSTAAITTMEYEPGGVQDLQEAVERLVPRARPGGRRLRPQHAQPRRQRARAPARVAARPVALDSPGAGEPRARHLAAGRADRFRRPAAGTVGPRPDHGLRRATVAPPAAEVAATQGLGKTWRRRAILRCPRWEPPGCPASATRRNPLLSPGATVFENSTACAPDGRLRPIVCVRPGSIRRRPCAGGGLRNQEVPAVPRRGARARSMCTSSPAVAL